MIFQFSVREGSRNLFLAGFGAFSAVSLAIAATIGFPFTEDFTDDVLKDVNATTADWDTASATLRLASANALTNVTLTREALGGLGEVGETSRDIVLGDLDGDGDLDAVVGNEGPTGPFGPIGDVSLIYENNNGLFNIAPIDLGTSSLKTRGLAIGDIDNDGDLDIVVGNYQGPGVYHLNDGSGNLSASNFTAGTEFTNQSRRTWKVGLVDVDSDGDLDYIEGNHNSENSLYINLLMETGSLEFADEIRIIPADKYATRSIALGDIDSDGDIDFIAGDQGAPNHVYRWFNGAFVVNNPIVHDNTNTTFSLALADLNGDGFLDLVEGNAGLQTQIYFNQGAARPGFFGAPVALTGSVAEHTTVALLLRDFDRDGDIDIVEGNNGAWDNPDDATTDLVAQPLRIYFNNGTGSFTLGGSYVPPEIQKIYGMYAGDVDSDGDLDFVTASSTSNAGGPPAPAGNAVYLNDGTAGPNIFRQLDGVAVSTPNVDIDGQNSAIPTARLSVAKVQEAPLTNLDFFVSNDNGGTFVPIRPDIPVAFPNANGSQLRWKVEMLSASPNAVQLAQIDQITIGPNSVPIFTPGGPLNEIEGSPVNSSVADYFSDPDGDTLTFQFRQPSSGLPAGTGISLDPSTGELTGTPTDADAQASPITLRVQAFDGADTRNGNITLNVADTANGPEAVDDTVPPIDEGGSIAGTFNVLDNDTDIDGDPLTAVLETPPSSAAVFELKPDGTFDYTHDGSSDPTTDTFTYRAADATSQSNVATVTLSINPVNDIPVISLIGANPVNVQVGGTYTDAGAIANDEEDGEIAVVVGGDTVDTDTAGTYVITYDATDSDAAAAVQVTRTVNVLTDTPPVITLLGSSPVNLTVGDSYVDAGATAADAEDGDISADIVVGGDTVNTATAGTYVITYNVSDSDGNAAAEVTRTVVVSAAPPPPPPPPPPPSSSGGGGGIAGIWELIGLMFVGLAGLRRRRAGNTLG